MAGRGQPYWGETNVNMGRKPPQPWTCPDCEHENKRYMANCWECGRRRPPEFSGRSNIGIVNLASHKVDRETVTI